MHNLYKAVAFITLSFFILPAQSAQCGDVTISEMNWPSAEFLANLDKIIPEEAYGCKVQLVPSATVTTFASMEPNGQPDVAPEL